MASSNFSVCGNDNMEPQNDILPACNASIPLHFKYVSNNAETSEMENKCDGVNQFQESVQTIFSGAVQNIMAEAEKLNVYHMLQHDAALQKEKERHMLEMNNLHDTVRSLEDKIRSFELLLNRSEDISTFLLLKLEQQRNMTILAKAFYHWHNFTCSKKQQEMLESIASFHYEMKLKRKYFHKWYNHLQRSWKQRMELKATMELYKSQKSIVDTYEAKIRHLQDSVSEVNKKLNMFSLTPTDYEDKKDSSDIKQRPYSAPEARSVWINPEQVFCLCPHPIVTNNRFQNYYSDIPPVRYLYTEEDEPKQECKIQPTSLPKCIPAIGTVPRSFTPIPLPKFGTSAAIPLDNVEPTITIERHLHLKNGSKSNVKKTPNSLKKLR